MLTSDRLRILMVADVSPMQKSGGSARAVREQTRGLLRRGHSVDLLCRHPGGEVPPTGNIEDANVFHYEVNRSNSLAYGLSSILGARRLFRNQLRHVDWDAVVFHQPFSAAGLQSVLSEHIPTLYYFYSPAGIEYRLRAKDPGSGRSPVGTGTIASLLTRLEKRALQRVNQIVVLSDFSRRLLEEHGCVLPRTITIPGGVDLDYFHPSGDRMAIKKRLGLPCDIPILFSLRDLEQRMGIDRLLRAVASLVRHRQLLCVVGGSGPLQSYLEQLADELGIDDSVRFVGHIPEKELPNYYQAADLFVLPTTSHEGFGLVTVEALACGTPVVATPVGATPEILGPLDPQLLSRDATASSLSQTIDQVVDDYRDSNSRRRCRDYVESRYSWHCHTEALEVELLRLLAGTISDGSSTAPATHHVGPRET